MQRTYCEENLEFVQEVRRVRKKVKEFEESIGQYKPTIHWSSGQDAPMDMELMPVYKKPAPLGIAFSVTDKAEPPECTDFLDDLEEEHVKTNQGPRKKNCKKKYEEEDDDEDEEEERKQKKKK